MTNYRSVVFNADMTTREEIITAMLNLGEEKGLANVSLSDIALEVGIRKASIFSHFESRQAIVDAMIAYCQKELKAKTFIVDFKAKDPQILLVSLVNSFLRTFTEKPLSSYFSIIQQQRMYDNSFADLHNQLVSMMTARVRVALEYCVQRAWLDINDTDIASEFFTPAILDCLCDVIVSYNKNDATIDIEWELDRLVDGLIELF